MPTVASPAPALAVLDAFTPATRAWFTASFPEPTPAQVGAWAATTTGESVLVSAPTGSGKTLAAFLAGIDRLMHGETAEGHARTGAAEGTRVLYVSPLKSLVHDVDRNLRAPLAGIAHAAERLGETVRVPTVGMRTGDTLAQDRRRMERHPPDILVTTPESLYLLLTSRARAGLATVETVIIDEIHAVAGTKRGAHLAVTLERLEQLVASPLQRVGLSATQRPLEEVARFLGGGLAGDDGSWTPRPVRIVDAPGDKRLDVEIIVPVEDMSRLGEPIEEPILDPAAGPAMSRLSIWPAVHPRILELIEAHASTIVFVNSRRLAERLCTSLNELADRTVARAHHGSVAREERVLIEDALKAGRLPCVVATSSLELGIDMGAVDLVIQVESPGAVSRGLQRIGRAGHQVGAPSVGKIFPKYRGDLVETAVVVRRMLDGDIEPIRVPRNPLDVLAQQVVAMVALDDWDAGSLHALVRGAANFAECSRVQLDGVLDMLSGRYPSDAFAELRPRVVWDRAADRLSPRPGAQRLAVTSGGTIPDRGLYGVYLAGDAERGGRRVGELDEEMVYETRPGETITLGASTWRIEDITRDRVLVTPAPGEPGKLPFWHGDAPGRPIEVGRALGAFLRTFAGLPAGEAVARLGREYGLDPLAARNLSQYVTDQREATGIVPSDRTIVVERFRDEIGDWRLCVLSPFGARVHAPLALALAARARDRLGLNVASLHADDGIVLRMPDGDELPALEALLPDPDEIRGLVLDELANSALFASRFRECAARALLLPRRQPGRRTPLWQQRQRAADLLAVASRYASFPIVLETYRECLQDVFDVPALEGLLADLAARRVRLVEVTTPAASPFASALLFEYVAGFLYEGDAPLAERRAAALSLDRELLGELLGSEELRELIDADALATLESELQRLEAERHATDLHQVHDLLRTLGDLREDELSARVASDLRGDLGNWLTELERQRRAFRTRIASEERWVAAEDAPRVRDGIGAPLPPGLPAQLLEPVERPLLDLVARFARTHGPFVPGEVTTRLGVAPDAVALALSELARQGRVVQGAFRPGGTGTREWIDAEVLRRLRRRSLAVLRRETEPVEQQVLARFLPAWHGVGAESRGGPDAVLDAIEQLQGAPIPASVLEADVLAARVRGYQPAWLDELLATGEVVWFGRGPLGARDGRVALCLREAAPLLYLGPAGRANDAGDVGGASGLPDHEAATALHAVLTGRGALHWPALYPAAGGGDEQALLEGLWDLVWGGLVTNDTFAPVRALTASARLRGPQRGGRRTGKPGRVLGRSGPPTAGGRWSLVTELSEPRPSDTERAVALADQLLRRHGILTRDAIAGEDLPGGFGAVYATLRAMEESGRARRGYFVEGLGGAQFALAGAIDRLRGYRDADEDARVLVLAATDPASPFGAALPWPEAEGTHQPRRVAGAHVVLAEGALLAYLEKGGRSLLTFTDDPDRLAAVAGALGDLVRGGRVRRLGIGRIDGAPPGASSRSQPLVAALRAEGFTDHPQGLLLRAGASRRAS